jgi:hypothetical protein
VGTALATDYTSAAEVLETIDRLQADVEGRLRGLVASRADAAALVASLRADHQRHARERARLRRRLGLTAPGVAPPGAPSPVGLAGLREAQQALVYAHAEGLPALADARAVDVLADHMVDLSRHLTIVDLWREAAGE